MVAGGVSECWEIQGFIDGYGDGCPAWSVGFSSYPEMVAYLLGALDEAECSAILVRRGRQVEVDGLPGPRRLVPITGMLSEGCRD